MASWNGTSESGILRKTVITENYDELLVFGYACKLFREDEKALYIDQGKHLIPWMGDESLKIDRYDCRGALSDLTKYEASREGYDATRWLGLSEKERNVEELCDKERYYSLVINEEEEQMYKEEEIKRLKTNTFQYSYDVPQNPELKNEDIPTVVEIEEEYVPPPILDLPIDINWPKTVKENARIEKTALFVCKQGPQMEILLKAKQADNPQFSFLNQDDKLYTFYRHILAVFKSGRYHGYEAHTKHKNENISENLDQDSSSDYLHPSLTSSIATEPAGTTAITIPQIPYKPSVNCSYSQLVNRIQGNQTEAQEATTKMPEYTQMTYEQQQYYQYYYVQQYFEYYKQLALHQQGQAGNPGQFIPPADFQSLDPALQTYIQQIGYNQYLQYHQQSNNSYAQIVTNVNKDSNHYATNVAQPQNVPEGTKPLEEERTVTIVKEKKEVELNKPLLSLAAYGSGTDSESEESTEIRTVDKVEIEQYPVPTDETKIVIDKMALYVSKNGEQFEEIVKTKNDPRFEFLHSNHTFYKYYKETLKGFMKETTENGQQKKIEKEEKEFKKTPREKKEKKIIAPVSFSIKKTKEEVPKEIKSALPLEESSDEEEESVTTNASPEKPKSPVLPSPPALSAMMWKIGGEAPKKIVSEKITVPEVGNIEEIKQEEVEKKESVLSEEDPILEMIELTEGVEEKKDVKRAEDKIKDKLAAAAREKLASVSRDKALQLERKKKAAAFLKLKSAETNNRPIEIISDNSHNSDKEKSPLRQDSKDSIEIIEIDSEESSPKKKKHKKDKDRHKELDNNRSRSRSREREKRKEKKKDRDRDRRRSIDDTDDEDENRKRKEKRKKSHKRKHSKSRHDTKSKRKSKKRHRKSESDNSDSTDSIL